jgi:hypothetical protein
MQQEQLDDEDAEQVLIKGYPLLIFVLRTPHPIT